MEAVMMRTAISDDFPVQMNPEAHGLAETEGLGHFWHKFLGLRWEDKWYILFGTLRYLLHAHYFDSHELIVLGKGVSIKKYGKGARLIAGRGVRISPGCVLRVGPTGTLSLGARTVVGPYTRIMAATEVRIGARCMISWNCSIFDSIGHRLWLEETGEAEIEEPITIGDDVWIGPYSIIMKGVTIGSNSVIGAGSVVRRDVPPNTLVYGNPARPAGRVVRWER
jgi:acetyltransferase-like isoleucine patch superfamily enzyme